MSIRFVDGSYQEGGVYCELIEAQYRPLFGSSNQVWSIRVLPYVCMIFESYIMHYNAPRFYYELGSLPPLYRATTYSFGLSALIYAVLVVVGFGTFGAHSDNYILNA